MRVVAFNLSGCPAGWLGAYGNEWVGTPNLDRLAAEAIVFDRHLSDHPHPDGGLLRYAPRVNESLRSASVRTVLIRANHPDTDGPPPFYAGWDEVFDARPDPADPSPLDALTRSLPQVLDRLQAEPRWLLWIETDRLIPPWDVRPDVFEAYFDDDEQPEPDPQAERVTPFADPPTGPFDRSDLAAWDWLHSTFAAVVTALDAELGSIFEMLRGRGLDQTSAWLVTSDFGYPLGEHGQVGLHRPWLHEELIHLPLILRLPGAAEADRRVPAVTQPADLASTLLDLFGIAPLPHEFRGFSLLPLAHGQAEKVRDVAYSRLELDGAAELAIRTDDWALVLPVTPHPDDPPREPMLFAKPDDRWEVNDLRPRNVETADELEAQLRKLAAEKPHDQSRRTHDSEEE
jgi:arylsulfatase A-like enzyme